MDLTIYKDKPRITNEQGFKTERLEIICALRFRLLFQTENLPYKEAVMKIDKEIHKCFLSRKRLTDQLEDDLSHWMLKVAFSSNALLRKQFLNFELTLFKHRYDHMSRDLQLKFLKESFSSCCEELTPTEVDKMNLELFFPKIKLYKKRMFKCSFLKVIDLVKTKKVIVLKKGIAYIGDDQVYSMMEQSYRESCMNQMLKLSENLENITDKRILNILEWVKVNPYKPDIIASNEKEWGVGALDVERFPPCMKSINNTLFTKHHIKYEPRLVFTGFLKDIGLDLEGCLKHFRDGFSKLSESEFNSKYAYSIKHAYGNEGRNKQFHRVPCEYVIKHNLCPLEDKDRRKECRKIFLEEYPNNNNNKTQDVGNAPSSWYKESLQGKPIN